MIFTPVKEPIPYLVIDKTFTSTELTCIYTELEFLHPKLLDPQSTGTAIKEDGTPGKKNTGVFLDTLYTNREFSDILKYNRKFFTESIFKEAENCHPAYGLLKTTSKDDTLLSYYDNNDYYEKHLDLTAITIITWFFKEPKNFTGGDLLFSDYNIKITPENNKSIIFLSCYHHEVTPVKIKDTSVPVSGRFATTIFCKHI